MVEKSVCEITITGTENREWQGFVSFPASKERQPFHTLLELIELVEHGRSPTDQMQKEPEASSESFSDV